MSSAYDRLPLGALRVFEAVATHLSFAAAAEALNVTPAAVSQQIKSLESYVQVPLFRRSGRRVEITEQGLELLPDVRAGLDRLESALHQIRQYGRSGPLQISLLTSFLQIWLLPRMRAFRRKHPEVELRFHTSRELVDFSRSPVHIGIRFGRGNYPNLHCEKLLDEWLLPVCAPALLKKHGPVRGVDDLRRYPLLHSTGEPWTAWLFDGLADDPSSSVRGAMYEDSQAVVRLAVQGDGLALSRWCLVADEIARGTLVAAGDRPVRFDHSYWLVWPHRAEAIPAARTLIDWLRGEAAAFPKPPGLAVTAMNVSPLKQ